MHASIPLYDDGRRSIAPEPEITTVPLKDDLSSQTSIQDLEWRERQEQAVASSSHAR